MAGKTISQRISLEGSEEIRKSLEALGNAGAQAFKQIQDAAKKPVVDPAQFAQSKQSIDQLVRSGSELARQFLALADQVKQFGTASSQAARSVDQLAGANDNLAGSTQKAGTALKQAEASTGSFLGTLGRITATVGVVGAAFTAAGTAAFTFAKSMASSVNEIVRSAEAAKQSAQSYQQLRFALEQMGLAPKEVTQAIEKMGVATKKVTEEGAAALQKFGFRFAPGEEGARALTDQMSRLNVVVSRGVRVFTEEQAALVAGNKAAQDFAESRDQGIRSLAAFADAIAKVKDPLQQAAIAESVFGKELADKLLPMLRKGGEEVLKFGDDFKRLGLGLTGTNIENAKKFGEAIKGFTQEMVRLGAVTEKGKINLGSIFQPIFTPLIVAATKALHDYTSATAGSVSILESFGKIIASVVGPAVQALIGLLPRLSAFLQAPDLGKNLGEGIVQFGQSVVRVVKGIVVPAFDLLVTAARTAAEAINSIFGTKLSGADVAILGVITSLVGGFKTLALAAAALFTGTTPGLDQFREKLKSLGIDIQAIKEVIVGFIAKTIADLKNAFAGMDDKVTQGWVIALRDGLKSIPAVVLTVLAAILLLKKGLSSVATFITQAFKIPASALGVGIVAAFLQLTGILPILTQLLIGAAAATTILVNGLGLVKGALTLLAGLVGWPLILAGAIAFLIIKFDDLKASAQRVADIINAMFGTKLTGAELLVGAIVLLSGALAVLITRATTAAGVLTTGALGAGLATLAVSFATATAAMLIFLALIQEVQDVMSGAFNKRLAQSLKDQEEIAKAFKAGGPNAMILKVKELEEANRAAAETAKKLGEEQSKAGGQSSSALERARQEARSLGQEARTLGAEILKAMQDGVQGADRLGTKFEQATKKLRGPKVTENPFFKPETATDQQRLIGAFQQFGQVLEEDTRKANALKAALEQLNLVRPPEETPQRFIGLLPDSPESKNIEDRRGEGLDTTAINVALAELATAAQGATQSLQDLQGLDFSSIATASDSLNTAISAVADSMQSLDFSGMAEALSSATAAAQQLGTDLQSLGLSDVASAMQAVVSAANSAAQALSNIQASGGAGDFARGGFVGGRGTGTSDSNLAWVSRGEHIMPARAVRQPGVLAFLEALRRSGGSLRDVLDDMGRFALGGLVPRTLPAFASGGMSNVTIQFPGMPEISGLRAPAKVVEELRKTAAMAQVRSGGRKPSRYS